MDPNARPYPQRPRSTTLSDDDDLIFFVDEMDFEHPTDEEMHRLSLQQARPDNPMSQTLQTQFSDNIYGFSTPVPRMHYLNERPGSVIPLSGSSFMTTPETPFSVMREVYQVDGCSYSKATDDDDNDADIEVEFDEDEMDEDMTRAASRRKRIRSSSQPIPYNPWSQQDMNRGFKDRKEEPKHHEIKSRFFCDNDLTSSSDAEFSLANHEGSFNSSISSHASFLTRSINNRLHLDSSHGVGTQDDYSHQMLQALSRM